MQRDDATERQVQAASPRDSTWLSANAGSGKTRVLTDRVARLLLEGVLPQHILCLTYTKAAASEMQNRLFKRLGTWAMKGDDDLRKELRELGVDTSPNTQDLKTARTLFARAIEAPGGLKIQTIHSFCAALLRRFPLEAGVSPLFREMEERAAELLREDITDQMADGPDAPLIETLARHFTGESLSDLTAAIIRKASAFRQPVSRTDLTAAFGAPATLSTETLTQNVFLGGEAELLSRLLEALRTGGTMDNKAADKLQGIASLDLSALPVLESVFLNGKGAKEPFSAKSGSFPTKSVRADHPDLIAEIEREWSRFFASGAARGYPFDPVVLDGHYAAEVAETAKGAAAIADAEDETMRSLIDRVRSPGGTTTAAFESLEADHVRDIFARAFEAARDRAVALADEANKD